MKAQVVILSLLFSLLTLNGVAATNAPEQDPQQEKEKKENQSNYNYNLFRFYSLDATKQQSDSTRIEDDKLLFKPEEE